MNQSTARGNGPGGVNQQNLRLWLKADTAVTTRGDYVLQWHDQSDCHNNAVQLTTRAQPTLINHNPHFNNLPTLHFNGQNQYLQVNHANTLNMRDAMTAFMVLACTDLKRDHGLLSKSMACENYCSYALAIHADRRQIWFEHYDLSWWRFSSMGTISSRPTIISFSFDSVVEAGQFRFNGQEVGHFESARKLATNRESLKIGVHRHCKHEGVWFSGDLAELILFDGVLNSAERLIIENYLAAKYTITVPSTNLGKDIYEGDLPEYGGYTLDVVGLGREADGVNEAATSAGLTVLNRTFLKDNGDYLMFGHKSITNTRLTTELPDKVNSRWERVWFFDFTDRGDNAGKLTFMFDGNASDEPDNFEEGEYVLLARPNEQTPFSVIATTQASPDGLISFSLDSGDLAAYHYYTVGKVLPVTIVDQIFGKVKDFWKKHQPPPPEPKPIQRPTVHERKHIDLVSKTLPLLDKGNDLTANDVKWALNLVLNTIEAEVPADIRSRVERIQESVLGTLPYIADVASSDHTIYVVRQVALEYLPQTLENYLNLPPQFANMEPLKEGKTARQLLLEQLDLLSNEMNHVMTEFHRQDAEKLMIHGRFLDEKFGRHGSSLLD